MLSRRRDGALRSRLPADAYSAKGSTQGAAAGELDRAGGTGRERTARAGLASRRGAGGMVGGGNATTKGAVTTAARAGGTGSTTAVEAGAACTASLGRRSSGRRANNKVSAIPRTNVVEQRPTNVP